ncbi:hypothetical protein AGABI1DRAFT_134721 [Agaricus bisporus var. burnettii JB137-S8]|uniref:Uncharacterized protein n=1 Tax=Agaricus bisporus var. burnettii (strain JB137-S8 / ATCC MYA-4627 / FGSC 10392) TaxID=597362 RepID=K5VGJ9_AGABU|nr:uncharacterized protein AGABI1DRAFT_134721 [Agaricus bisporus var. burnettii JB137-S8]EKM73469.1 hypothetical protein AGABI1DRAFT_134721 [Agaricus bisporus var. burnettii JB137-S8]
MERLLKFCDTSFQKWAPNLHAYYRQTMDKLGNHPKYRNIEGAGQGSVFGSMTVNYGSSVVTVPHRDHKNLAFGWCAVVALAVEFPPGSAALIPSAVLTHSNALIAPQDQRASVTFYSLGSIFRFVDNGFQTLRSVQVSKNGTDYKLLLAQMKGDHRDRDGVNQGREGRWKRGLALYSTLQQLSENIFE